MTKNTKRDTQGSQTALRVALKS